MSDELNEKKDVLKPHQYDGIQEYDNQLPKWWINGFYLSILFGALYFAWYQLGEGESLIGSYRRERIEEMRAAELAASQKKVLTEEELLARASDDQILKLGKDQYAVKCASCHLLDGGGLVGPNLTDDYWIHGNKLSNMVQLITKGVSAKGMPAWGAMMSENEIIAAAAYVRSLHGTKPAQPKAPEGELIK